MLKCGNDVAIYRLEVSMKIGGIGLGTIVLIIIVLWLLGVI